MPKMDHPIVYAPERRIRGDVKVLSYDSVDLFTSDQYSLRRRGWLTDAVVTFAAQFLRDELISDDKRNMVEVLAAAVTECIKFINPMEQAVKDIGLSSERYNFFLVNDNMNPSMVGGGTHWSLLVYDPRRRGFVFLDSRPSTIDSTLQLLANNIAAAMGLEHLPIEMPPCPKMDINGDCGVYLIEFIRGIFKQLNEENFENPYIFEQISQDDINRSRKYWFCKIAELGSKVERSDPLTMAYMYKNYMRAIAKWPRDPHKGTARNLLPYLEEQVNIAFKQSAVPPPTALCERRLKALNELLENKHVTDFPNNYKSGVFGLGFKELQETNSDAIRNTIGLGAPKEGFFKSLFGSKKEAAENA